MIFQSNGYDYLEIRSFANGNCDGTATNGIIAGTTMNLCQANGNNVEMRRCDVDINQVVVTVFGGQTCSGAVLDTYRLPIGCLPTESGTSSRELCLSAPDTNAPFALYGAGVVSASSGSEESCNGPITSTTSWTFQPLNTCIVPSDGGNPTMITSCSSSAGTMEVSTYEGASDCSGDATGTETVTLAPCAANENNMWANQVCVDAV